MIKNIILKIIIPLFFREKTVRSWVLNNYILNEVPSNHHPQKNERKRIWVLVTPWLNTAVPFFSAQIANSLEGKGFEVGYLFDLQQGFANFSRKKELISLKRFKLLLNMLNKRVLIYNSENKVYKIEKNKSFIKNLFFENYVKINNSEEKTLKEIKKYKNPFYNKTKQIKYLLKKNRVAELVIPGGVYGWSGVYIDACKSLNIPYWTYDSGERLITLGKNCIATHFDQFEDAHKSIRCSQKEIKKIEREVAQIYIHKKSGTDIYGYLKNSKCGSQNSFKSDALMLLNYRCDSAAMLRSRLFPNVQTWIYKTAKWFENNKFKLIIRRHPCEINPQSRSSDQYKYLKKLNPKYIKFFDFDSNINTYSIIAKTKVVLPFSSRVGIEALFLKKPIIISSRNYYKFLPDAHAPNSILHYFRMLKDCINKQVACKKTFDSILAYFLSEKCLFKKTSITPLSCDFKKWAFYSKVKIEHDKGFNLLLKCICENRNFIYECFREEI